MSAMPKVATMPSIKMAQAKPAADHPAVVEHIAKFNDMANELDRLRNHNNDLRTELEIARGSIHELQLTVDHERKEKERFQRYAVKADTYFDTLAETALRARDESHKIAADPPKQIGQPMNLDEMEAGVAEIAAKFAPKQEQENTP